VNVETCLFCGEPTGRSGDGEDSLYFGDIGPWCEECFDTIREAVDETHLDTGGAQ
jgi:hypothetical protein